MGPLPPGGFGASPRYNPTDGKPFAISRGQQGIGGSARGGYDAAHPGFKGAQASIAAKEGVGKERAGAILAAATRRASPAAKKANPRLKRVKG